MLIKILKPFSFKGTKYQEGQQIEVQENVFWRKRIEDKDVYELSLEECCEYYAKEKNKEQFDIYAKKYNEFLSQILNDIAKIPNDKLTPEQVELKKETNLSIKNLVKLESDFQKSIISEK